MREFRSHGSVRGAEGNFRPYRDRLGVCGVRPWMNLESFQRWRVIGPEGYLHENTRDCSSTE